MIEGRFMVAVGAVIENSRTGHILLMKRAKTADFSPDIWEIPSGRMKQFEELEQAMGREMYEEAGLRSIEIVKPRTVSHFYRGGEIGRE